MDKWHSAKLYRIKKRDEIIDFLGAKCAHCGLSDKRILQIDHKYGDGRKERDYLKNTKSRFYQKIKDNPNLYQLLCANCNWIKRVENNEQRSKSRIW